MSNKTNSYEKEKCMNDNKQLTVEEIQAMQEKPKSNLSEEAEEMLALFRVLTKLED
jgi:hypothetical protein